MATAMHRPDADDLLCMLNAGDCPASAVIRARRAIRAVLARPSASMRSDYAPAGALQWPQITDPAYGAVAPCCIGRRPGRIDPCRRVGSCSPDVLRSSEIQHPVQHVGSDGHFSRLAPIRLRAQPITDDAFPP